MNLKKSYCKDSNPKTTYKITSIQTCNYFQYTKVVCLCSYNSQVFVPVCLFIAFQRCCICRHVHAQLILQSINCATENKLHPLKTPDPNEIRTCDLQPVPIHLQLGYITGLSSADECYKRYIDKPIRHC